MRVVNPDLGSDISKLAITQIKKQMRTAILRDTKINQAIVVNITDRDGWLDLLIVNYVDYDRTRVCSGGDGRQDFCGPSAFAGTMSRLFHNLGKAPDSESPTVQFEDVSVKSGLADWRAPGLGAVCADFTGDRWPDMLITNDGKPNWLCVNQGDGTFREEATQHGVAVNSMGVSEGSMGIAVGDLNNDGLFDVFVTHLVSERHRLWMQGPAGIFDDATARAQLLDATHKSTGFGALFVDFDNDGDLDLAIANGAVKRPETVLPQSGEDFWKPYWQTNQLIQNQEDARFQDVSRDEPSFCDAPGVWRALASGDFDNDGGQDLLVTRIGDTPLLLHNTVPNRGHWLSVRAVDPDLKRDAYGAVITVVAGEKKWTGLLNPGRSYVSSCDPRVHFGLGAVEQIDQIIVLWPDGREEMFPGQTVDRFVVLERGKGRSL